MGQRNRSTDNGDQDSIRKTYGGGGDNDVKFIVMMVVLVLVLLNPVSGYGWM